MLTGRPDPPLDFDETVDVLRQLYPGRYVTVALWHHRFGGPPMVSMHGWCLRLDEWRNGVTLVVREDPSDARFPLPGELRIVRDGFERAGEAMDADAIAEGGFGPLQVEFLGLSAIVSARDLVPQWDALERPGRDSSPPA